MSLEILNLSLEKISKLKKKYACRSFFGNKICVQRVFFVSKKTFARIFFLSLEKISKLRFKISKLIFFEKKKRNLKNTHTQRLSLENSPNSRVEFGDFPELRFKRNKIPNTCFFFTNQNEFGEFSKLKCWVWRILQTQIQKIFFLSLENSPNSRVEFGEFCKLSTKCIWKILKNFFKKRTEFGEFSKLRCKISKLMFFSKSSNSRVEFGEFSKLKCWVWRILQTQIQKKKIWVWRILQTQVQNLQTHLFLKKMNWRKKNSEAQRFSRSPMSRSKLIFFWKPMDTKKKSEIEIESRLGSKSRKGFSRTKFCYTKTII